MSFGKHIHSFLEADIRHTFFLREELMKSEAISDLFETAKNGSKVIAWIYTID